MEGTCYYLLQRYSTLVSSLSFQCEKDISSYLFSANEISGVAVSFLAAWLARSKDLSVKIGRHFSRPFSAILKACLFT